jgi:hypothetical protein
VVRTRPSKLGEWLASILWLSPVKGLRFAPMAAPLAALALDIQSQERQQISQDASSVRADKEVIPLSQRQL